MFRGPSQPRLEKRIFPCDLRAKCRPQPPCPHPPKLVLAPAGSALRPDVSRSYHRAVLRKVSNCSFFRPSACAPKDALLVWSSPNDSGSVYGIGNCKHDEIAGCFG